MEIRKFVGMRSKTRILLIIGVLPLLAIACGLAIPISRVVNPTSVSIQATIQPPVATAKQPEPIQLPAVTTNEEALLIDLYRRANPAVVNIITYTNDGNLTQSNGQGSGFVYDDQGDIITNSHVVHGANAIEVVFSEGTTLKAEPVGEDLHSDLAVIQVGNLPSGIQPLPLGDIREVAVGQTVIAIGNPFGLGGTLTRGIVSALGRSIPALTAFSIPQAIQTDAPINPGNSGGPLLNLRGEVVGVNAQIETGDGSRVNSGIGFAIPVSIVSRVIPSLIKDGEYQWGWLGVVGNTVNPTLIEAMDLPVQKGAYISQVVNNGPAERAGLKGSKDKVVVDGRETEIGGDIVVAIDGQPVSSFDDILIYVALNTNPGQEVTLTIIRDGQTQDVKVTLLPRPTGTREFTLP
jgi:S1-C subfamily serine protease